MGDVVLRLVFIEKVDGASADRHVDDSDIYVVGSLLYHGASEVVDGCEAVVLTAEWRHCYVPFAALAPGVGEVDGCHHLEACVESLAVLRFDACVALHVRLSEAEVDVEVGVELLGLLHIACTAHSVVVEVEHGVFFIKAGHVSFFVLSIAQQ